MQWLQTSAENTDNACMLIKGVLVECHWSTERANKLWFILSWRGSKRAAQMLESDGWALVIGVGHSGQTASVLRLTLAASLPG
jgi:hypothetical protein